MILPLVLLALFLVERTESCPQKYRRFSRNHSFCLSLNQNCDILKSGINFHEKQEILDTHNALRSRVATGKEHRAGHLPEASDMMQMEWDKELSRIAQNWASQCETNRDCRGCRAVGNFTVSQLIAYKEFPCLDGSCAHSKPTWTDIIEELYNDDIRLYDKNEVSQYSGADIYPKSPDLYIKPRIIQGLTQVIWANTWRVGCGYATFEKENAIGYFYVCNYGPGGNNVGAPVYSIGKTCSHCPSNTCCGKSCSSQLKAFNGLCKMLDTNTFPNYRIGEFSYIFNCDFHSDNDDCNVNVNGQDKWTVQETLAGNIKSIQLGSGEESQLVFKKNIKPTSNICLRIVHRQGPALAGIKSRSILEVSVRGIDKYGLSQTKTFILEDSDLRFSVFHMDLQKKESYDVSITYKVPQGSPDHILDIRGIVAYEGNCNEFQDITRLHYP